MKLRFIKIKFLVLLIMLAVSCSSYIDGEFNVNPNEPVTVPVNAMLPQIGISVADLTGGNFSRFNSILTQQVEGIERQFASFNQYSGLTPEQFNTMWQRLYEKIFIEADILIAKSGEDGYNHYRATGEVLKAYALMLATDVWGDIPYTEAGLGLEFSNPVYDDQATVIYPAIFALLESALNNFNKSNGGLALGSDDVFFGGDIDKWKRAIKAIRSRAYLHQGEYSKALVDAQDSFQSREDNLRYTYSESSPGPWDRFLDIRGGMYNFILL